MSERVNLDVPRWDQTQYWGRVKYFFTTTNPLNIFKSESELEKCKQIVTNYKLAYNFIFAFGNQI